MYCSTWGHKIEETLALRRGAKAHNVFDTGPVIPATTKDNDLAPSGESLDIALQKHLSLFAV